MQTLETVGSKKRLEVEAKDQMADERVNSAAGQTPRRVLLDCDPGIDDAVAILYLAGRHHAGEIDLVGVSTMGGNATAKQTAVNARWLLDACGLPDIPVGVGEAGPADRELVTTPETHGPSGLGHFDAHLADGAEPKRSWRELWQQCLDGEEPVDLIVTGPLTNAAQWDNLARFRQVTVMGGAVNYRGNTTPTAEWNFWVDPLAAHRFFHAQLPPVVLCSLEVTEQFLITPERADRLAGVLDNADLAEAMLEMLRFYFEFHDAQGEGYQAQVHDAVTAIVTLGACAYDAVPTTMDVEVDSPLLRGTSVADLRGHWGRDANASLVTGVDIDRAHAELERGWRLLAEFGLQHPER